MRNLWCLCLIASIGLTLGACSKPATSVADTHETAVEDEDTKDGDPCSLLEPKEVEAVLGQPLSVPPYVDSADEKSRDTGCHYVGADLHQVSVDVTWSGAAMVWKMLGMVQGALNQHMKGMLKLADGTELAGEWDEARVQGCCTFMAMRGDQIVEVNVAGSKAGIKDAASLADAALKRIDKPLAIKAGASEAATAYFAAHRPKSRGPCELVSRADAEALLGKLSADPQVDGNACRYELPSDKLRKYVELRIQWQDGYRDFRENAAMSADIGAGFGIQAVDSAAEPVKAMNPTWEAAGSSIGEFSAVKKDVLIKTDTRTGGAENAEKMVALAMSKI